MNPKPEATGGTTQASAMQAELLPPKPQLQGGALVGVVATAAAGVLGLLYTLGNDFFGQQPSGLRDEQLKPSVIVLTADQIPSAIIPVAAVSPTATPYLFTSLAMPEADRKRLEQDVAAERVRVGAVILWDNVAEDGDVVEISGGGFHQRLTITHTPNSFFVPYFPGGSIRVIGTHDGGGGITLGIKTALGDQFLPPLLPNEVIEIQIP